MCQDEYMIYKILKKFPSGINSRKYTKLIYNKYHKLPKKTLGNLCYRQHFIEYINEKYNLTLQVAGKKHCLIYSLIPFIKVDKVDDNIKIEEINKKKRKYEDNLVYGIKKNGNKTLVEWMIEINDF